MLTHTFLLTLLPFAYAQAYGGSGTSSSSFTSSTSSTVTTSTIAAVAASASSTAHDVDVGKDGLVFTPDTLKASVGDTVNFHFYPLNHSVVQSSFSSPCTPLQSGIYGGFHPSSNDDAPQMFSVTINNTSPIWLYCAQTIGSHCQSGMSMIINPPTNGNTLAAYKAAAKNAPPSVPGSVIQGGLILPNKDNNGNSASSSSIESGSASVTASASGSPSTSPTTSSSSTSAAASPSSKGDSTVGKRVEWAFMGVALVMTGWA